MIFSSFIIILWSLPCTKKKKQHRLSCKAHSTRAVRWGKNWLHSDVRVSERETCAVGLITNLPKREKDMKMFPMLMLDEMIKSTTTFCQFSLNARTHTRRLTTVSQFIKIHTHERREYERKMKGESFN
jgi:hypothetical protein